MIVLAKKGAVDVCCLDCRDKSVPLDDAVFAVAKSTRKSVMSKLRTAATMRGDVSLLKNATVQVAWEAMRSALKPNIAIKSFENTGLWPFDGEKVISHLTNHCGESKSIPSSSSIGMLVQEEVSSICKETVEQLLDDVAETTITTPLRMKVSRTRAYSVYDLKAMQRMKENEEREQQELKRKRAEEQVERKEENARKKRRRTKEKQEKQKAAQEKKELTDARREVKAANKDVVQLQRGMNKSVRSMAKGKQYKTKVCYADSVCYDDIIEVILFFFRLFYTGHAPFAAVPHVPLQVGRPHWSWYLVSV